MTTYVPLYKKDSTGKIRVWEVSHTDKTYTVSHGVMGGKMQSKATLCGPKNVGRANETSPEEQAGLEAAALHLRQIERNCYVTDLSHPPAFLQPQLAQDASKPTCFKKLPAKVILSPKLDGARTIYRADQEGSPWQSRKGTYYPFPKRLWEGAPPLDGELYLHGVPLNQILSAIKKPNELTDQIEFHVFDVAAPGMNFEERQAMIKVLAFPDWVKIVPQTLTPLEGVDAAHDHWVAQGYEGVMLRRAGAHYGLGERNPSLQKYKKFFDQEFVIADIVADKDGGGKLVLTNHLGGKDFTARPMGTDAYRAELLQNKEAYIGQDGTIKYQGITEYNVPQFPVCTAIGDVK